MLEQPATIHREAHTLPGYGEMEAWLEMAKAERDAKFPDCPWVFFDDQGRQIGTFQKAWARACARARVPGLLFYDLRRSAAMNMVEAMFLRHRAGSDRDLKDAAVRVPEKQPTHDQAHLRRGRGFFVVTRRRSPAENRLLSEKCSGT